MSINKILYVDMDNVLVDFQSALSQVPTTTLQAYDNHYDDIPGLFSLMQSMPGAIDAFQILTSQFDTYILSTAPWENPSAWSDKLLWIKKHLGEIEYKRLILSHHVIASWKRAGRLKWPVFLLTYGAAT